MVPSTCWECSVCCGTLVTVEGGRVTDIVPNPAHPYSQGRVLHQGRARRARRHLRRRPRAASAAPRRAARQRALDPHLVGCGARRDGGSPGGGARAARPSRHRRRGERRLLQPRRHRGAAAALDRQPQLDDQPGSVRRLPRRERAGDGPQHHVGRGHRAHELRPAGRPQSACRRPGPVGGDQAGQAARRAPDRDRPEAHPGLRPRRPVAAAAPRHRRGARAGDDRGADRGEALRPRFRRALVPRLRRARRSAPRNIRPPSRRS